MYYWINILCKYCNPHENLMQQLNFQCKQKYRDYFLFFLPMNEIS